MKDTHSYKGWLNSDNFWHRALAIYGYQLALSFAAFVIVMVIGLVMAMFGSFMR
jgi:hypothetical protein